MVDSKTIVSQVQELQLILHEIHAESMTLSESFQVAALIEKLPPSWRDFKNYRKHKCKEIRIQDLIVRLRIEEDNRNFEKIIGNNSMVSKANIVEQGYKTNNKKRKHSSDGPSQDANGKIKKFKGTCWICDKPGHRAKDCRKHKNQGNFKKKPAQAHVTEVDNLSEDVSELNLSIMISKVYLVGNLKQWWIDTLHIMFAQGEKCFLPNKK